MKYTCPMSCLQHVAEMTIHAAYIYVSAVLADSHGRDVSQCWVIDHDVYGFVITCSHSHLGTLTLLNRHQDLHSRQRPRPSCCCFALGIPTAHAASSVLCASPQVHIPRHWYPSLVPPALARQLAAAARSGARAVSVGAETGAGTGDATAPTGSSQAQSTAGGPGRLWRDESIPWALQSCLWDVGPCLHTKGKYICMEGLNVASLIPSTCLPMLQARVSHRQPLAPQPGQQGRR